ncbi:MAG: endonuclease [Tenericutes bacterium]|nr:endonuclease [Mycoplasmatota bacterium]
MKKVLILFGIIITSFALFACEEYQTHSIDQVVNSLEIEYSDGESISSVESNVILPTSSELVNIVQIVWVSSNPDIISNQGIVTQPTDSDTTVTLTLHVNMGSESRVKDFELTVLRTYVYHTVTFETQDQEELLSIDVLDGEQATRPDDPVKEGFDFVGWFLQEDLENPYLFITPITSNITLIAVFEEQEVIAEYTVKVYYQNIEDDLYVLGDTEVYQDIVGETVAVTPQLEGFIINDELSNLSGVVTIDDLLLLEVYFDREIYTVTFISDGIELYEEQLKYESPITSITDPVKEGYDFIGWTLINNGVTLFDFGTPIAEDTILYAKWLANDEYTYEGYYEGADGLTGSELTTFLRNIVTSGLIGVDYGEARYILDETDQDPNNSSRLILVYLGTSVSGTWDFGTTWNREHVWPQSLLGSSADNATVNPASDLHNLKPANPNENSSRSNKYFDNATTSSSYEPRDEVKGDIARILFFMVVRYDYLNLVNGVPGVYQMGKLDTLLQWHIEDPVDAFEQNRNDVIYSYQNNRNPFIDHPEFVEKIWGPITLSSGETITLDFTQIASAIIIDVYVVELSTIKKEKYMM